jgi:hypothetical protein
MPSPAAVPVACPIGPDSARRVQPRPACSARPRWPAAAGHCRAGRHGRACCGVPHAGHQLTQVGIRIGGELVTGMPQIVKRIIGSPAARRAGRQTRRQKLLSLSGLPWGLVNTSPVVAGRSIGDDVRGKVGSYHFGNGYRVPTGVGLRRPEVKAAATWLAQLPRDPDGTSLHLDIGPPQRGQLTPAPLPKTPSNTGGVCLARCRRPARGRRNSHALCPGPRVGLFPCQS